MLKARPCLLAIAAALLLSGCGKKEPTPTINASMTGVMEPAAQAIWDIVSNAYNDRGDALVASRITDADWKTLDRESARMKARAAVLAKADHITVAAANEPVLGSQAVGVKGNVGAAWDAVDAPQIQARIDDRHDLFRDKADDLVRAADAINRAALTKDAILLYKATSGLDEVCDGCHEPFWGTDEPPPFPHGGKTAHLDHSGVKVEHARLDLEKALTARAS